MGSKETKKKKTGSSSGGRKNEQKKEQRTMITDERFSSAQSDPRFMQPPKKVSKVEIDSRFSGLFTDPRFASSKAPIDKRGKPIVKKSDSSFKRNYSLEKKKEEEVKKSVIEDEDDDEEGESEAESQSESENGKLKTSIEEDDEEEDDDEQESMDESSSTDTTDSDSEFEMDDEEEDSFLPQEDNIPEIEEETKRLAVVNMDWSHVGAADIFVLLSSFLPKGGQIMSVSVYPTEFGLERMKEEATHGPVALFDDNEENEDGSEEEEDDEIDNKKLRAYELSRLRYYYAVVECDSVATADYLYKTCDGVEFERSANRLDLRFIPDSMDFKHKPRDVATEAPAGYEGLDFQTMPLQHSNIHISWDEDEPHRSKTLKKILNTDEPDESELNGLFASDESETDEDGNEGIEKISEKKLKRKDMYRSLLQSGGGSDEDDENDQDMEMEMTFNSGLEDMSRRILEKKDKKSESVWEAHLKKRKEKKKAQKNFSKNSSDDESSDTDPENEAQYDDFFEQEESLDTKKARKTKKQKQKTEQEKAREADEEASRAELELLLADDNGTETNLKGFNMKPKKNKGKKGKEKTSRAENLPSVDTDERFSALLTNPLFALDPTDPQFKRSATYARQKAEKQKMGDKKKVRRSDDDSVISTKASEMLEGENDGLTERKEATGFSSVIRSIKMKSQQLQMPSERKVQWKIDRPHKKAKTSK